MISRYRFSITFFDHSTVSILRVELSKLKLNKDQKVNIKLASMNFEADSDVDDYLAGHESTWGELNLSETAAPFLDLPEAIELSGGESKELTIKRGYSAGKLLLLMPHNAPVYKATVKDQQSIIL